MAGCNVQETLSWHSAAWSLSSSALLTLSASHSYLPAKRFDTTHIVSMEKPQMLGVTVPHLPPRSATPVRFPTPQNTLFTNA